MPAVADTLTAGSGGLGEQRREPLHPPEDGDVVDLDTAFGEQFFDVAEGQAETQIPTDRQHDHRVGNRSQRRQTAGRDQGEGEFSCRQCTTRALSRPTQL